ncbi:MAG: hypothetical protein HC895_23745 [Leptolyngbyaceae cyanobacterium SM1_3_5]|nr:hypothetical protein [Leptolyngbyaceae cyanobacterium SM1_3_5]
MNAVNATTEAAPNKTTPHYRSQLNSTGAIGSKEWEEFTKERYPSIIA